MFPVMSAGRTLTPACSGLLTVQLRQCRRLRDAGASIAARSTPDSAGVMGGTGDSAVDIGRRLPFRCAASQAR